MISVGCNTAWALLIAGCRPLIVFPPVRDGAHGLLCVFGIIFLKMFWHWHLFKFVYQYEMVCLSFAVAVL
jgi:hypothetical protein